MKDTGIIRQIDDLGRIVIPMEIRRSLGIAERDPLEIHVRGDRIILGKPVEQCVFCTRTRHLDWFMERAVCDVCRAELAARAPSIAPAGTVMQEQGSGEEPTDATQEPDVSHVMPALSVLEDAEAAQDADEPPAPRSRRRPRT